MKEGMNAETMSDELKKPLSLLPRFSLQTSSFAFFKAGRTQGPATWIILPAVYR
jgi:hypothetical protein